MSIIHKALLKTPFSHKNSFKQDMARKRSWLDIVLILVILTLLTLVVFLYYKRFTNPAFYNKPLTVTKTQRNLTHPQIVEMEEVASAQQQADLQIPPPEQEVFV